MGVSLSLHVVRRAIDPAAWAEVYDDTLRLLRAHPSGLLGLDDGAVLGHRVPVYTRHLERVQRGIRAWCVAGDRTSLRCAGSFCLPRELGREGIQGEGRGEGRDEDLALQDPAARGGDCVLAGNTQGEPYHVPVLAAAMVIESRFPGAALVSGDVQEEDAEEAKRWAEQVLEREVALPVLFDAPALLRRLAARWRGDALFEAFVQRFRGRPARGLSAAFAALRGEAAEALLRAGLRAPLALDAWWPGPGTVMQGWLMAGGDVARLCEIACLDPAGPGMDPVELIEALVSSWALVSPGLQRRIERARQAELPLRADVSLGAALVAMMVFHGWQDGAYVEPAALDAAFARALPAHAPALSALARAASEQLEEALTPLCDAVEAAARLLDELGPYQDLGDLVALASADDLSEARRRQLATFAYVLRELWSPSRRATPAEAWLQTLTADGTRELIAAAAEARGPALTEQAWGWLLREADPAVLALLARLACTQPQDEEGHLMKRALLESRVLCEAVAGMMADEEVMAEARALLEEERRGEARARSGAQ